jgi:glycolate oxidase FAD binding subunit
MKLYTGSFGTLGIISQLTLKVKPLSEAVAAIVSPCPPDALEVVLKRLMTTATRPTAISVANGPASEMLGTESPRYTLLVAFEEKATTVGWQVSRLRHEMADELDKFSSEFQGDLATGLLHKWSDFPLATQRGLTFKANMLPAATAGFFRRADALGPRPALVAHAGNGIVFGHLPPEATLEEAKAIIETLGRAAAEASGNVVIVRCPAPWKAVLPVWGGGRSDNVLMRAVKQKLDPQGVFNPGRFVDGI